MKAVTALLWIVVVAALLRGVLVFDTGSSAESTYPVASAICLVGGLFGGIALLRRHEAP